MARTHRRRRFDAGHGEGIATRNDARRHRKDPGIGQHAIAWRFAGAEDADGRLEHRTPALDHDDHDAAAISDKAAIELVQRIADHRRGQHLCDSQRIADPCLGIERRPLSRRDRDARQDARVLRRIDACSARRSARSGRSGNGCRRALRIARPSVPVAGRNGSALSVAPAALPRGIADQRHLAASRGDRQHRMMDEELEGGAAHIGRSRHSVAECRDTRQAGPSLPRPYSW